jgi:hypothetical protein
MQQAIKIVPTHFNRILVSPPLASPVKASCMPAPDEGTCSIYFWHFGHQKVERPFWVNRRTIPPQPALWHFSPSRS